MGYLTSELYNTEALIMVEQHQIDEVILEHNYDKPDCKTQDCGVEIGMLLGIKNIIVGSFHQIADTCLIKAQMVNVKDREAEKTIERIHIGDIEGVLPKIQAQLVNVIEGEIEKSVEKTHIGDINEILPKIEIAAWELANLEPSAAMLAAAGIFPDGEEDISKQKRWKIWIKKAVNYIANRWQGFLSLFTKE